jgi:hypothetical protein
MQATKRTALSWLVVVLGSFLGLLALVAFGMGGPGSNQSGEVPRFFAHAGMGLLGLCLIVGSNVALRRRRLAGMIFFACMPFVAFCMTYPNAGYLVWHPDGSGWFESPFPATAAFLTFLFFAPLVVLFFTIRRRKLVRYLFPISACLAWIPFGLNHWARSLLPGLGGWSIFFLLFALFWLGTHQRGWPPLVQPGKNLGRLMKYLLLLGVLLGLVFWADGRATIIAGSLLWFIVFPGEPRRRKRIFAAVAMGIFLTITVALKLKGYAFRHRSERLLADVKSLEMRKTTYSEARRVLQKWPELRLFPPGYDENHCKFDIILDDRVIPKDERGWERSNAAAGLMGWACRFFGRHKARVQAQVSIQRGVVWGKYFSVGLEIPSVGWPDHALFGAVDTVSRFYDDTGRVGLDDLIVQTLMHPDYLLEQRQATFNADTPVALVVASVMYVHETQYADPAVVRHLEDFDFSCMTRWFSCRNVAELMPMAWAEYQRDQPRAMAAANQLKCTPEIVETQAGNAQMAAVVEVSGNRMDSVDGQNHEVAKVRMVEPLRGDTYWKINEEREFWVSPWALADTSTGRSLALPQGKRFILLFFLNGPMPHSSGMWPYPCGVIPWSEENLALVQHGIAEDPRANAPPPYVY